MHENIIRLEISMHDIIFGEYFEGFNHLLEVEESFLFREWPILLHLSIQSTSIAILIYEIEIVRCFEHVNVPNDIGAGLDSRENVYFVHCTFLEFRNLPESVCFDYLDRNLLFSFHMNGPEYFSINSFS